MRGRLARVGAEFLGVNRRNHSYLFAHNPRTRYHLVDDKRATKIVLAEHGVPAPVLHAVCDASWKIGARLRAQLEGMSEFALKPARGAGGAGIVVVTGRNGPAFVRASGAAMTWPDVAAHAADVVAGVYSAGGLEDALLVEDLVIPEPTLAALAHRGVPDLRVLVFRGVPVLAMLRLPTRRSDGRANLHMGGVGVGIALGSGTTTHGVLGRRPVDVHPDLGTPLAGVVVPTWPDVLAIALRAADAVGLGFLGVDVVLDVRHGPLVLELNARPGLAIQVANRRGLRPLLDAVATAAVPASVEERVALGQRLVERYSSEPK
jgi:alpha-L-glutamate ligase-like protein